MRHAIRYRDGERRPFSFATRHLDVTTMPAHQLLHEREPNPRPLVRATSGVRHAMKPIEYSRKLGCRNADTSIAHLERCGVAGIAHGYRDSAVERVLECV